MHDVQLFLEAEQVNMRGKIKLKDEPFIIYQGNDSKLVYVISTLIKRLSRMTIRHHEFLKVQGRFYAAITAIFSAISYVLYFS